jgi:hypothetical protein
MSGIIQEAVIGAKLAMHRHCFSWSHLESVISYTQQEVHHLQGASVVRPIEDALSIRTGVRRFRIALTSSALEWAQKHRLNRILLLARPGLAAGSGGEKRIKSSMSS